MLLILALFLAVAGGAWGADLVITGARIYTMDQRKPVVSSLVVTDGKVVYSGDDASPYLASAKRHIDVHGATIVPGFIDSHGHVQALGDKLETFDLRNVRTISEVAGVVKKEAARRAPGEWIRGQAWDQTNWGGRFPTAADLDEAAPRNPVYLTRVDGHAAWVNHEALRIAGITAATPDPAGGRIVRTEKGEPAGILVDKAEALVNAKIPPPAAGQLRARIARAAHECARLGLTTVHDAGIPERDLTAYRELIARGELPIRVYAMIGGPGPLWDRYRKSGPEIGDRLTVRSIKLISDGAMGSRGAAFFEPYSDDPGNRGLLILSREEIERVAREAVAAGFQVNTHAIGDRANHTALEAYAAALGGPNDRRFRIEHAQVIAPADFALFRKYSIIASMQATHATSDMRWAVARMGPERVKGAYAWRTFLKLGVPVTNGSDFPVEDPNPLYGFYAAITRQDRTGEPKGGWFPEQRMAREEALKSWTLAGAYAAFEEDRKGSLVEGKLADFAMLSADIMRIPPLEILTTHVTMTVVGGKIVYEAGRQEKAAR